jgi:RND family efflux transporter MFP subunit
MQITKISPAGEISQRTTPVPEPKPPANGQKEAISPAVPDRKRQSRLIAIAAVAAVLAAALGWRLLRPAEIAVLEIRTGSLEIALSVVGRVRPKALVDVRSANAGQVARLLRNDGDVVAAGAPLAIVRADVEKAQDEASIARVTAARAEVDRVRLIFNRTRTLAERGVASAAALDEAKAVLRSAEADYAAADAEHRAAAARSGEFVIRAPMAGIVLLRAVDAGQVISPATTLFQLGSMDGVELQAEVDETYADALRPGMLARAALSGDDRIFSARLTEVSPRVDAATGGRLIKIAPVEAMNIPPGRSVDVTIIVERRDAGIVIPRQAVTDATTAPAVLVVDRDGVVRARPITIMDWPARDAIVETGLEAGDRVVLAPDQTKPAASVRVRLTGGEPPPET